MTVHRTGVGGNKVWSCENDINAVVRAGLLCLLNSVAPSVELSVHE
ncbi:hypothetical protein [Rosistilla ulvae]|nr:hypothetical protein [Rosistilla ulvae]